MAGKDEAGGAPGGAPPETRQAGLPSVHPNCRTGHPDRSPV